MNSYRKEIWIKTKNLREFLNLTAQVRECLEESLIQEGLLLCHAMHMTTGILLINNDPGLQWDYEGWLEKLAPENSQYYHNSLDANAHAHLKATVLGRQTIIAVSQGELELGPFEQIYYADFDGNRRKRVLVKIIGS